MTRRDRRQMTPHRSQEEEENVRGLADTHHGAGGAPGRATTPIRHCHFKRGWLPPGPEILISHCRRPSRKGGCAPRVQGKKQWSTYCVPGTVLLLCIHHALHQQLWEVGFMIPILGMRTLRAGGESTQGWSCVLKYLLKNKNICKLNLNCNNKIEIQFINH